MRQNLNKPIDVARRGYTKEGVDFDELLLSHNNDGFVVNTPYLFGMGYFYEEDGLYTAHITYACGDLLPLLRHSLNIRLDFVEFKRNFSGRMKKYSYEKFKRRFLNG